MRYFKAAAVAFAAAGLLIAAPDAQAGGASDGVNQHPQSDYYRGQPQVRGFRQDVGGFSYSYKDGLIDSRDESVFLDPELGSDVGDPGPFNGGFFFDSGGVGPIDESPYP